MVKFYTNVYGDIVLCMVDGERYTEVIYDCNQSRHGGIYRNDTVNQASSLEQWGYKEVRN